MTCFDGTFSQSLETFHSRTSQATEQNVVFLFQQSPALSVRDLEMIKLFKSACRLQSSSNNRCYNISLVHFIEIIQLFISVPIDCRATQKWQLKTQFMKMTESCSLEVFLRYRSNLLIRSRIRFRIELTSVIQFIGSEGHRHPGVFRDFWRNREHQPKDRSQHRQVQGVCLHPVQGCRGPDRRHRPGGPRGEGEEDHLQEGRGQAGQDLSGQPSTRGNQQ